jgi:hypothetical protein
MELVETTQKIRCEMGACGELADYTVVTKKHGIRKDAHFCGGCLAELREGINGVIAPKGLKNMLNRSAETPEKHVAAAKADGLMTEKKGKKKIGARAAALKAKSKRKPKPRGKAKEEKR